MCFPYASCFPCHRWWQQYWCDWGYAGTTRTQAHNGVSWAERVASLATGLGATFTIGWSNLAFGCKVYCTYTGAGRRPLSAFLSFFFFFLFKNDFLHSEIHWLLQVNWSSSLMELGVFTSKTNLIWSNWLLCTTFWKMLNIKIFDSTWNLCLLSFGNNMLCLCRKKVEKDYSKRRKDYR